MKLSVSKVKSEQMQTNQKTTQDELQWIVAQRLLSALTVPGSAKSSAKDLSFTKSEAPQSF